MSLVLDLSMFTGIYSINCKIKRESTVIASDYQSINRKIRTPWKHGDFSGETVKYLEILPLGTRVS